MAVRGVGGFGTGEHDLTETQLFTNQENELFSRLVSMAEKQGKPVQLLVVPGVNPFDAMVQSAARLKAIRLVTGVSARMDSEELARRIGRSWENMPQPRHPFSLEIISPDRPSVFVNLGPHPPRLWPQDIELAHEMWLELSEKLGSKLHHRDVVGLALRRLQAILHSPERHRVSAVVLDLEPNLIAAHLAGHQRVLLFGPPGSGKSTLIAKLAAVFAQRGVACACMGADPGSPAFGVPGAVCFGQWTTNGWVCTDVEPLCSLDAGRFRLPLSQAIGRLMKHAPRQFILLDGPGVVRGAAAAELLAGIADSAEIDAVTRA